MFEPPLVPLSLVLPLALPYPSLQAFPGGNSSNPRLRGPPLPSSLPAITHILPPTFEEEEAVEEKEEDILMLPLPLHEPVLPISFASLTFTDVTLQGCPTGCALISGVCKFPNGTRCATANPVNQAVTAV